MTRLRVNQHKLLAAFQIGQQIVDLRVFRWSIETDGTLRYIDNRGERDIACRRRTISNGRRGVRTHVTGKHPHVNILDTIFVETIGGDLTIKVDNNTETGLGISRTRDRQRTSVSVRCRDLLRAAGR